MQIIDILQIDDNKEHCERLKTLAWRLGNKQGIDVRVKDFQTLEEGFVELEREIKYKALILDAKCVINKGENEDLEFLSEALRRLDEINRKTNRIYIPFVINTGFAVFPEVKSQERSIRERKGEVFDKSDEDKMLAHLFAEIINAENTKIEKQFADIFEIFDKNFLDAIFRGHLLKLLKTANSDDPTEIKKNLALLRSLQEQILQTLNKKDNQIVPDAMCQPNVSFRAVHRHLSGNKDRNRNYQTTTTVWQNNWIESLSECIYSVASDNGSHSPYNNTPLPNKYTVQSLTFAFLEQLLWFKKLMS